MASDPVPSRLFRGIKFRIGQNTYVFLVCVAIAVVFWLLNAMAGRNYQTFITLPVKYVNLPSDQVVKNKLPGSVLIEIEADGFSLLSQRIRASTDTIEIDGSMLQQRRVGNEQITYVSTRTIFEKVADQLKTNIHILRLVTDSIYFEFDQRLTRIVPVVLDLKLDFEKQYLLDGEVKIVPAAVKVLGPKSIIDTLTKLISLPMQYHGINSSITTKVGFQLTETDTTIHTIPGKVLVKIPVDQFTEASIRLPVKVTNMPDSFSIKLFPDTIDLTYQVALNKFEKVSRELFVAEVDFNTISKSHLDKLKVKLTKMPAFVKLVKFTPEKLEYIIRQ